MVYTRSGNQTASLPNQTACVQPTKQKSMHALSLVGVSQARGYRPDQARHMLATKQALYVCI